MSNIKYVEIPYVNKKVSKIFFGTAMMPFIAGQDGSELLEAILATGVNALDMARNYGLTERSIGAWIERTGRRDELVLLSKCGHPTMDGTKRVNPDAMRADFAESAKELHTDYIDIYLLHRDDPEVEVGPIVETFNALHAEGKIGAFGGSNWTHQRIQQANEYAYAHDLIPFTVSSPNYGLADQVQDPWGGGCVTISGPSNADAREWYAANQMPVIAYSSMGRGLFSGRLKAADAAEHAAEVLDPVAMRGYGYPENFERLRRCEVLAAEKGVSVPQIAMAFIFGQKVNTFAVVSTPVVEQMQQNIDAMNLDLTESDLQWLNLERELR